MRRVPPSLVLAASFGWGAAAALCAAAWVTVLQAARLLAPDDGTAVAVSPLLGVALGAALSARWRTPPRSRIADGLEVAFLALALLLPPASPRLPEVLSTPMAILVLPGIGFVVGRELQTFVQQDATSSRRVLAASALGASVASFVAALAWSTLGVAPTSPLVVAILVAGCAAIVLGRRWRRPEVTPADAAPAEGARLPDVRAHLRDVRAHLRDVRAHLRAVRAHLRAVRARLRDVRAHLRDVRAHLRAAGLAIVSASMGFVLTGAVVLFERVLQPYVGDSLLSEGALAAVPLAGIAVGAMAVGVVASRIGLTVALACAPLALLAPLIAYGGLEWFVPGAVRALGGIGSVPRAAFLVLGVASAMLLPIAIVAGAVFALDLERRPAGTEPFARMLTASTAGSLVAGDLVPALLGTIGVRTAFLVLIAGSAVVTAVVARLERPSQRRARFVAPVAALAVAALSFWIVPSDVFRRPYEARYGVLLAFDEEQHDTILVTDDPEQGRMIRYGDGRPAGSAGADPEDRFDAQLPMLLHPKPLRVLQIGLGAGSAISSVLQHPVESADVIEPSAAIAESASLFEESNQGVLGDDRLHVHAGDSRQWLAENPGTWDVIRIDLPDLHVAGSAGLYTRELLELARDRLAPGGILSLRLNLVSTPEAALPSILRTVLDVFPHVTVWHGPLRYAWVINASLERREPDPGLLAAKLEDPDVEAELASLQAGDAAAILGFFVMGTEDARALAGEAPAITIERPRVDAIASLSPDSFYGLGSAASDTALANLTDPTAAESVSVRLLFEKIQAAMAQKKPLSRPQ